MGPVHSAQWAEESRRCDEKRAMREESCTFSCVLSSRLRRGPSPHKRPRRRRSGMGRRLLDFIESGEPGEFVHQGVTDGIPLLRPVERNGGNAGINHELNVVKLHVVVTQSAAADSVYRAPSSAVILSNTSNGFSAGNSASCLLQRFHHFLLRYFLQRTRSWGKEHFALDHPTPNQSGDNPHHTVPGPSPSPVRDGYAGAGQSPDS